MDNTMEAVALVLEEMEGIFVGTFSSAQYLERKWTTRRK